MVWLHDETNFRSDIKSSLFVKKECRMCFSDMAEEENYAIFALKTLAKFFLSLICVMVIMVTIQCKLQEGL